MIVKKSFVLAIGQVLNKILGMVFIYILSHKSGNASIYTSSYLVFSIFSDIATIGLIPGTSKIVSETDEPYEFLIFGRRITLFIGVMAFIIFITYAYISNKENFIAMLLAGLSLLITPRYYFNKGYVQGQMKMMLSSISSIIEGIVRVLFITIALKINSIYFEYLALFSNFFAILCANIVLRTRTIDKISLKSKSYLVKYFNICLPYGVTTLFFTLYQAVDVFTLKRYLVNQLDQELISSAYLYQANRLIYLPIMIASSFAATLIPSIKKEAKDSINKIFNYLSPIIVFFYLIYNIYGKDIYHLIYPNNSIGFYVLQTISFLIIVLSFYKVLLGIVQGVGGVSLLVSGTWISFLAKFILNKLLIPILGYVGAYYSTLVSSFFCITIAVIILKNKKINVVNSFIYSLVKYILVFIVSLIICVVINKFINITTLKYSLFINVSLLGFFYVAIIVSTILWKFNK